MGLKKHGITVDCEHCKYTSSDDRGAFDITVPVIDSQTGVSGPARLRCIVSAKQHRVELLEWDDFNHQPTESIASLQQRVSATLGFVADRQVCGNLNICPAEVIRIVEKNSNS
jgi:hypothetical protein